MHPLIAPPYISHSHTCPCCSGEFDVAGPCHHVCPDLCDDCHQDCDQRRDCVRNKAMCAACCEYVTETWPCADCGAAMCSECLELHRCQGEQNVKQ